MSAGRFWLDSNKHSANLPNSSRRPPRQALLPATARRGSSAPAQSTLCASASPCSPTAGARAAARVRARGCGCRCTPNPWRAHGTVGSPVTACWRSDPTQRRGACGATPGIQGPALTPIYIHPTSGVTLSPGTSLTSSGRSRRCPARAASLTACCCPTATSCSSAARRFAEDGGGHDKTRHAQCMCAAALCMLRKPAMAFLMSSRLGCSGCPPPPTRSHTLPPPGACLRSVASAI